MRKFAGSIVLFFLFLILVFPGSAQYLNSQRSEYKKVGYVNSDSFHDSKEGIPGLVSAYAEIDLALKPQLEEISGIKKKLTKLIEGWKECIKSMWCGEGNTGFFQAKTEEGKSLHDQLVLKNTEYETQRDKLKESQIRPLEIKVQNLLRQYAKEKGYDLVIDVSKLKIEEMNYSIFNEPSPDVTKDFIQFCKNRKDLAGSKESK